jgi:hypothetical protein
MPGEALGSHCIRCHGLNVHVTADEPQPHKSQTPGLSTYLPQRNEPGILSAANAKTPVLQCHGDADMVVSAAAAGWHGAATLTSKGTVGRSLNFLRPCGASASAAHGLAMHGFPLVQPAC